MLITHSIHVLHLLGDYLTLRRRAWFRGDHSVLVFPIGSLLHSAVAFQELAGDVEFADSVEARMLQTREILQPTAHYNTLQQFTTYYYNILQHITTRLEQDETQ